MPNHSSRHSLVLTTFPSIPRNFLKEVLPNNSNELTRSTGSLRRLVKLQRRSTLNNLCRNPSSSKISSSSNSSSSSTISNHHNNRSNNRT